MELFSTRDYRKYLSWQIKSGLSSARGGRKALAEAAGCHPSYIAQVCRGIAEFTRDHALGAAIHWHLKEDETQYFLKIVELARSSSKALRERTVREIEQLKKRRESLASRLKAEALSSNSQLHTWYYSSWLPSCVHIAVLSLSEVSTENLAQKLGTHVNATRLVCTRLEDLGILERASPVADVWRCKKSSLHLDRSSPLLRVFFQQWTSFLALKSDSQSSDINFTSVLAISKRDAKQIRQVLVDAIATIHEIAANSKGGQVNIVTIGSGVVVES